MAITDEQMSSLLLLFEHDIEMVLDYYDDDTKAQKEAQLTYYLQAAMEYIERQGISLDYSKMGDMILTSMYASYLYEKRNDGVSVMPRALRYELNNRVFQEKLNEG